MGMYNSCAPQQRISCHYGQRVLQNSVMVAFKHSEEFFDQEPEFDL